MIFERLLNDFWKIVKRWLKDC